MKCLFSAFLAAICFLFSGTGFDNPCLDGEGVVPLFSQRLSRQRAQNLYVSIEALANDLPHLTTGSTSAFVDGSAKTVILTFLTPAFKDYLFNFLCFLHYRLPERLFRSGSYVIATSDPKFAQWLASRGVITLLQSISDGAKGGHFVNARRRGWLIDLAGTPPNESAARDVLPWGSLAYQSLMLERTLTAATLVSLLASARSSTGTAGADAIHSPREEADEDQLATDRDPVGGVLLVDSDTVWLSSPLALIHHPYRITGPRPALVYALDAQLAQAPVGEDREMPCACFVYSRTADFDEPVIRRDGSVYHPSLDAAHIWRHVALCHLASVRNYFEIAGSPSTRRDDRVAREDALKTHKAPSFQRSSLGPAIYLSTKGLLPFVSHDAFTHALSSGSPEDLEKLLERVGLGEGQPSCDEKAQWTATSCMNPAYAHNPLAKSERARWGLASPARVESLPYAHFPPGQSFFDRSRRERGIDPCVVHANYAESRFKRQLLEREGLWALRMDSAEEPMCHRRTVDQRLRI